MIRAASLCLSAPRLEPALESHYKILKISPIEILPIYFNFYANLIIHSAYFLPIVMLTKRLVALQQSLEKKHV